MRFIFVWLTVDTDRKTYSESVNFYSDTSECGVVEAKTKKDVYKLKDGLILDDYKEETNV